MEYTVMKLAQLSGQTPRTIRHYDEIELLKPCRMATNGYRIYGQKEVDRLVQILFYRELGLELGQIADILQGEFREVEALQNHIAALEQQKIHIQGLIDSAQKIIKNRTGEFAMTDWEKFAAFKKKLVEDNEQQYGKEIREKYGNQGVERANEMILNRREQQQREIEQLNLQLNEALKQGTILGDPTSEIAKKACQLHKEWLTSYWGFYDRDTHLALAQTYVDDERFYDYYQKIAPGCAAFLLKALTINELDDTI